MTSVRLGACAVAFVLVSGCATIIRGTKQDFTVQTDPPGASAQLSTGENCPATPCTFERTRNEPFTVTISKPGFVTETHEIRNPWSRQGTTTGIVGNAILGGGIGIGVDAMTGANRDLTPNPLMVTLRPDPAAAVTAMAAPAEAEAAPVEAAASAEPAAPSAEAEAEAAPAPEAETQSTDAQN